MAVHSSFYPGLWRYKAVQGGTLTGFARGRGGLAASWRQPILVRFWKRCITCTISGNCFKPFNCYCMHKFLYSSFGATTLGRCSLFSRRLRGFGRGTLLRRGSRAPAVTGGLCGGRHGGQRGGLGVGGVGGGQGWRCRRWSWWWRTELAGPWFQLSGVRTADRNDDEAEDVELYNTICVCQFVNRSDKFLINKPSNWYPGSRQEVDNTFK